MDTGMALGILPGPYRIRHYECEAYSVTTNKCPLGPYRGVSRPQACFSIERAMDAVATELGLDPLDVRRRNVIQADEYPYESITGLMYDSGSTAEGLEKLLEVADLTGLRERQTAARAEGRLLGIGVAQYTEQTAHTTTEFLKRARADHLRLRLRRRARWIRPGRCSCRCRATTTARATRRRSRSWWRTSSG